MPQSENILIVDANVDYANKLGTQLQSENFIIHYAENVIAAKDIVKHKSIHIALIDVHLTHEHDDNDWSGIELAMQIRAYTSVIMMAQRPTFEMVRLALAPRINSPAPASDFITKADDVETIITAIRKVLNFNQQQDTKKDARVSTSPVNEQWHPSSSGHFALNHQTRIAKVGDETIALTEREYRLMKFFMDNVDTVVTREDIVTQVLNEVYNPISDTNRVNNIISRLRRRIERPNEKPIVVDLGLGWMYPSEHQFVVSVPDHYLNLPPEPELAPQETAEEGEEDLIVFGDVDEEVDDEIAIEPPVEKSRPDSKLLPPPAPPPAPKKSQR